jgi:hypothetical protein
MTLAQMSGHFAQLLGLSLGKLWREKTRRQQKQDGMDRLVIPEP